MEHNNSQQAKERIVYTRFDDETFRRLREVALADERPVAYLVRIAVEQYLNRRKAA